LCQHQRAGDGICQVIVGAGRVIDVVAIDAAADAALEAGQLPDQPIIVEQRARPRIHQRQKVQINFRFRLLRWRIIDASAPEAVGDPLTAKPIPVDL
jgi:hypothetical protein